MLKPPKYNIYTTTCLQNMIYDLQIDSTFNFRAFFDTFRRIQ